MSNEKLLRAIFASRRCSADAVAKLNKLCEETSCEEYGHREADAILLDFIRDIGHGEVADAWLEARDAIEFWYA